MGRSKSADDCIEVPGVPSDMLVRTDRCTTAITVICLVCALKVAEAPADLLDRRVEITGPVDRKMVRLASVLEHRTNV